MIEITDLKNERNNNKNNYEIIKTIGFDKYGELFLVSYRENDSEEKKLYIMEKIEVKSKRGKFEIENKINTLKKVESKYVIKIYDFFFNNENGKDYGYIIMEYCEKGNLYKIIYDSNFLNERTIWRIFIQLTQALKSLYANKIILNHLNPKNIFIDKNNNIKIGGFDIIFEFTDYYLLQENEDLSSYMAPEILNNLGNNKKSVVWSLGCILFELLFRKRAFEYEENKYILRNKFEFPDNCEEDIKIILPKLLCKKSNRLSLYEIMFEGIFKRKIIEINIFDEILKDRIQCKYIFI